MEEKYIFRTKAEKEFTVIRNSLIKDKSLTWGARGLLIYLLSKSETWVVRKSDLVAMSPASNHVVARIMKELETSGYMKRERTRNKKEQWEWHTWVYDDPQPPPIPHKPNVDESQVRFSTNGKPIHGKPGHIVSTELKKNKKEKKNGNNNITAPKNEKAFAPLKKKILAFGWDGKLDEVEEIYNEDPERVKAWVDHFVKKGSGDWAGLFRQSLRSGKLPFTQKGKELARRDRYVEDMIEFEVD